MVPPTARRSALLAIVLMAGSACSSAPPGTDSDGSSGGATSSGGSTASGGRESSGDAQGSGGSVSGSGGRGGLTGNQCTDAYGCGAGATCYAPGVDPPAICGAPQWCGLCTCPAMPTVPQGSGNACSESGPPCPSVSDTVLRAASVCNPDTNVCTECLADDDCSENLPYCGAGTCYQCKTEADCSEQTPYCYASVGACRQCSTTADCVTGVCSSDGACIPGCQTDAECGPNRICGSEQRCVPQPCQGESECSEQSTCSDQTCRANTCTGDAACPSGYCVGGSCYETPGGCQYDTAG